MIDCCDEDERLIEAFIGLYTNGFIIQILTLITFDLS